MAHFNVDALIGPFRDIEGGPSKWAIMVHVLEHRGSWDHPLRFKIRMSNGSTIETLFTISLFGPTFPHYEEKWEIQGEVFIESAWAHDNLATQSTRDYRVSDKEPTADQLNQQRLRFEATYFSDARRGNLRFIEM